LPTGGDPYGNGVSVVVRVRESLIHGEGRQADQGSNREGRCDAESQHEGTLVNWRAGYAKRCTSGSEGGSWKRTAPAALRWLPTLHSSSSGCAQTPPGKTLKPGFLSHGGMPFASVIFRQDTPCNEQGQGTNGGPKRGPDLPDNHGIAYRQQCPGRQSPRSRHQPKGDRTQGFSKKGVTRMSSSALVKLEALLKCATRSRSCVWRAGCTKTCPSGSGGGGWIPLITRGWPPTSSLA